LDEAISYYLEVLGRPGPTTVQGGCGSDVFSPDRLGLPFQTRAEMEQDLTGGTSHPPLSVGSGGPEVSELQQRLNLAVAEAKLPRSEERRVGKERGAERAPRQSGPEPDGGLSSDTW